MNESVDYKKILDFVRREVAKIPPGKDAVVDYPFIIKTVQKLIKIPKDADPVDYDKINSYIEKAVTEVRGSYKTLNSGGPTTRFNDIVDVNVGSAVNGSVLKFNGKDWVPGEDIDGAVDSVNGQTGTVVLDADDINDSSTAHKFVTSTDLTKLSNLSGTNTGDQTLPTRDSLGLDTDDSVTFQSLTLNSATASRLASFGETKNLEILSTTTYPSLTEIAHVKGVTSAIQTQLGTKITASSSDILTNKTIDAASNTITNTTGYILPLATGIATPVATTWYYVGYYVGVTSSGNPPSAYGMFNVYIPKTGKIKSIYLNVSNFGTLSSNETSSITYYKNGSLVSTLFTGVTTNTTHYSASSTGLSLDVTAGDYIYFQFVSANWVTAPTNLRVNIQVYVE